MIFKSILGMLIVVVMPALPADWNPRAAAAYLDSRQKEWFAWPAANSQGSPCLSCHTGLPYLLARPALRKALGESGPTEYEARAARRAALAGSTQDIE